jgi:uncharacterized protein YndB with AHSA1/START domain
MTRAAGPGAEPVLVMTRVFEAPPRRVYEAWTRPEQVVRGWGLPGFAITALQNDVWPGGAHRTSLRGPNGDETRVEGVYRELSPPARLVLTQRWNENGVVGHETLMTVDFALHDGRTLVRLELSGASASELAVYRAGVSECLDRIADYLAQQCSRSGPERLRQCGCVGGRA